MDDQRCEIHRTRLELDPIRGWICPHCDQEAAQTIASLWHRLWRFLFG